jgi:hypothetical protein
MPRRWGGIEIGAASLELLLFRPRNNQAFLPFHEINALPDNSAASGDCGMRNWLIEPPIQRPQLLSRPPSVGKK